jgi:hypothetical protein
VNSKIKGGGVSVHIVLRIKGSLPLKMMRISGTAKLYSKTKKFK